MSDEKPTGLDQLRMPFPPNLIGKLPKPTRKQTDEVKADYKKGIRCQVCGGWHHPDVIHLDYVGHAALTDRFLDVDPNWSWEPVGYNEFGLPALDNDGLLWIKLTLCGTTRIGVGDAGGKVGGDAMKERIGDALRNAGMRFGAALDLWHKGDLHVEGSETKDSPIEAHNKAVRENLSSIVAIKDGISTNDYSTASEAWAELGVETQRALWVSTKAGGVFTTSERKIIHTDEFKKAYLGEAS